MKITLTPAQCAAMIPDPDKIYTYHSYDPRGFTYEFEGTPAEYKIDREQRMGPFKALLQLPIPQQPR